MNINATLLVQAAHFWIAYLFIRFMILKPAYQLIKQERTTVHDLEQSIKNTHIHTQLLYEKRYQVWDLNHRLFLQKAPTPTHLYIPQAMETVTLPKSLHTDDEQVIQEIKARIVEELKECV